MLRSRRIKASVPFPDIKTIFVAHTMSAASSLFSVTGKNVLVTGGSRGIGFMIAKGFAQAGANVLLTSRDEKACAAAASEINCQYVISNVATREGCKDLAVEVSRVFNGNLHVLVNNVSTGNHPDTNTFTAKLPFFSRHRCIVTHHR